MILVTDDIQRAHWKLSQELPVRTVKRAERPRSVPLTGSAKVAKTVIPLTVKPHWSNGQQRACIVGRTRYESLSEAARVLDVYPGDVYRMIRRGQARYA